MPISSGSKLLLKREIDNLEVEKIQVQKQIDELQAKLDPIKDRKQVINNRLQELRQDAGV